VPGEMIGGRESGCGACCHAFGSSFLELDPLSAGFWTILSSAFSVSEVFSKFSEGVVLTKPSLLVCSGLDAMSGFSRWSWWSGIPASPSGLWCGVDAWVFCFFLVGFAPEL
jgi:hypothetical protein